MCWLLFVDCSLVVARCSLLFVFDMSGLWLPLVCWLLVVGCWLLVVNCLSLVVGC